MLVVGGDAQLAHHGAAALAEAQGLADGDHQALVDEELAQHLRGQQAALAAHAGEKNSQSNILANHAFHQCI